MSLRIVRVQLSDGTTIPVRGRVADFIHWLALNKEKVEPIHQGELAFNWSESDNGSAGSFRPTIRAILSPVKLSKQGE